MAHSAKKNLTRRGFLGAAGAAGLSACSSNLKSAGPAATAGTGSGGGTIKIGFISPETGSLSVFGQPNGYVLGQVRAALAKGLTIGGKKYSVEIIAKDSQSSSTGAATAASQLIQQNAVNMLIATSTPNTVNPVSEQAEASGVPCLNTICPWELWYYNSSGGVNTKKYSFMYFLGTQQEVKLYGTVWKSVATDKVVGGLWPNDVDGAGFQKYITAAAPGLGLKVVPSGAYADGTQDFASIITKFKSSGVQILHGAPIPPDMITFWKQAHQNGFKPRVASISKALLFPAVADALGPLVDNVMSPVWWTPAFPYSSSLDGTSASAFASGYKTSTGKQWTQPMGFNYAIFEIAVAALKASGAPTDAAAVVSALGKVKGTAITGPYDFSAGPVPNVCQSPELLGQWRPVQGAGAAGGTYDLVVVNNSLLPAVPVQGSIQPL
jgi:branched-chain amino acid transport system substrate-binding protein